MNENVIKFIYSNLLIFSSKYSLPKFRTGLCGPSVLYKVRFGLCLNRCLGRIQARYTGQTLPIYWKNNFHVFHLHLFKLKLSIGRSQSEGRSSNHMLPYQKTRFHNNFKCKRTIWEGSMWFWTFGLHLPNMRSAVCGVWLRCVEAVYSNYRNYNYKINPFLEIKKANERENQKITLSMVKELSLKLSATHVYRYLTVLHWRHTRCHGTSTQGCR